MNPDLRSPGDGARNEPEASTAPDDPLEPFAVISVGLSALVWLSTVAMLVLRGGTAIVVMSSLFAVPIAVVSGLIGRGRSREPTALRNRRLATCGLALGLSELALMVLVLGMVVNDLE